MFLTGDSWSSNWSPCPEASSILQGSDMVRLRDINTHDIDVINGGAIRGVNGLIVGLTKMKGMRCTC
jgi:proteasome assembly chaperone (PAC2) family protein